MGINVVFFSLGSNSPSLEAVATPGHHGVVTCTPRQWVDSEDEIGEPETDWSSHVDPDILRTLSDTEKRRQEIINGKCRFELVSFTQVKMHVKRKIFIFGQFLFLFSLFRRNLSNGTKSCSNTAIT